MLKGYPLRDYTWKDWVFLILTSGLVLQLIAAFLGTMTSDVDPNNIDVLIAELDRIAVNASVYGTLISLPLTLLVVYWRKIPIFNRKQLSRSESFILPGLTKSDWSFLAKYIPASFVLYTLGNVVITYIFGEMEAVNQEAIESLFDYIPVWLMFLMIVVVAPITEEVLFRGIMVFRGKELDTTWVRVIISAILFGLIHTPTNIPSLYSYVGMGIMFSYAAKKTQTVEAAIVYHFLNNLLAFFTIISL